MFFTFTVKDKERKTTTNKKPLRQEILIMDDIYLWLKQYMYFSKILFFMYFTDFLH